jgi:hypothetical protein
MNAENSHLLERTIMVSLPTERAPTEHEVLDLATRLRAAFSVTDDDFHFILKRLHARMRIEMDTGVFLASDHRPWLSARRPDIDPFYWDRFRQLLMRKDWQSRSKYIVAP